ncbi:MAG: sodium:glutamate symporter, partial [Spirochaetes bacterium]
MGWAIVIDFTLLSLSLLVASILRANIGFLKRFHVPNAITAGFVALGLIYLLDWLIPNLAPDRKVLGNIVYHLLSVTFISIGLKKRVKYIDRNSLTTAFNLSLGYA